MKPKQYFTGKPVTLNRYNRKKIGNCLFEKVERKIKKIIKNNNKM